MRRIATIVLLCASSVCRAQPDSLMVCLGKLAGQPRFSSISGKLIVGAASSSSPGMLADTAVANDRERQAIADWAAARGECLKAVDQEGNAAYRPPLLAYSLDAENKVLAAAVDLYDRRISFGEFNRRRETISDEQRSRANTLRRQIQEQRTVQEAADRHAREIEQIRKDLQEAERQASVAQQQASQAQQAQEAAARRSAARGSQPHAQPPAPLRSYTNCFRFGSRMVCTPY